MLPEGLEITYQEEAWSAVLPELEACWKAHWDEIAHDKDKMPLDVDYASYAALEAIGALHIVTVRVDGELAGYHAAFIRPHLHYHATLCAWTDVYYVKPAFRQGYLPITLFRKTERFLRARGVQKLFAGCKVEADKTPLFRRLRWRKADTLFTKWIGD